MLLLFFYLTLKIMLNLNNRGDYMQENYNIEDFKDAEILIGLLNKDLKNENLSEKFELKRSLTFNNITKDYGEIIHSVEGVVISGTLVLNSHTDLKFFYNSENPTNITSSIIKKPIKEYNNLVYVLISLKNHNEDGEKSNDIIRGFSLGKFYTQSFNGYENQLDFNIVIEHFRGVFNVEYISNSYKDKEAILYRILEENKLLQ